MFLNDDIDILGEGEVNELSGDMMIGLEGVPCGFSRDWPGKPFDCTEFCTPKTIENLLFKFALDQKVEVDFPNCQKWVPKKLSWDLENENSDIFCIYRFNQLIDNASRTYL